MPSPTYSVCYCAQAIYRHHLFWYPHLRRPGVKAVAVTRATAALCFPALESEATDCFDHGKEQKTNCRGSQPRAVIVHPTYWLGICGLVVTDRGNLSQLTWITLCISQIASWDLQQVVSEGKGEDFSRSPCYNYSFFSNVLANFKLLDVMSLTPCAPHGQGYRIVLSRLADASHN